MCRPTPAAYDRIFPTRSLSKSKDFQVNGVEDEVLQEAHKIVGRAEQVEKILTMIRERKNGPKNNRQKKRRDKLQHYS